MTYRAEKTVQITTEDEPVSPSLVVHESKDGHPACGTGGDEPRDWRGHTMVFTPQDAGDVDRLRCEQVAL
jgi:hypothetical protein